MTVAERFCFCIEPEQWHFVGMDGHRLSPSADDNNVATCQDCGQTFTHRQFHEFEDGLPECPNLTAFKAEHGASK